MQEPLRLCLRSGGEERALSPFLGCPLECCCPQHPAFTPRIVKIELLAQARATQFIIGFISNASGTYMKCSLAYHHIDGFCVHKFPRARSEGERFGSERTDLHSQCNHPTSCAEQKIFKTVLRSYNNLNNPGFISRPG